MRRIINALRLFWFGLLNKDLLTLQSFRVMARILELTITVTKKNSPLITHLYISKSRVASLWIYSGLAKNPTDRIAELNTEIDELKSRLFELEQTK